MGRGGGKVPKSQPTSRSSRAWSRLSEGGSPWGLQKGVQLLGTSGTLGGRENKTH